jgi:hypothetical protein
VREVSRLASVDTHPASLRRNTLRPFLAHLERRLGDLFAGRLGVVRTAFHRSRSVDGGGALESESEGFDLIEGEKW